MQTVNRGWLRKQVEAGTMEAKCDYHLTDDYAYDNANNDGRTSWLPARIRKPVWMTYRDEHGYERERIKDDDFVHGAVNLLASDFHGKSGRAWKQADGHIALIVHSNRSYTLRAKQSVVASAVKPRVRYMAIAVEVE